VSRVWCRELGFYARWDEFARLTPRSARVPTHTHAYTYMYMHMHTRTHARVPRACMLDVRAGVQDASIVIISVCTYITDGCEC
jgi:hypothetical protein